MDEMRAALAKEIKTYQLSTRTTLQRQGFFFFLFFILFFFPFSPSFFIVFRSLNLPKPPLSKEKEGVDAGSLNGDERDESTENDIETQLENGKARPLDS